MLSAPRLLGRALDGVPLLVMELDRCGVWERALNGLGLGLEGVGASLEGVGASLEGVGASLAGVGTSLTRLMLRPSAGSSAGGTFSVSASSSTSSRTRLR